MTEPAASPRHASDAPARLVPLFIGIVVVEILAIAALGWFGRHFS